MKLIVAVAVVAAGLSACSSLGEYEKPCVLEGVKVSFLKDTQAQNTCRLVMGSKPDHPGQNFDPSAILGCSKASTKEVVVSESGGARTLVHELRHLLERHCPKKP